MIITDETILRLPCSDATSSEVAEIVAELEKELSRSASLGRAGIGLAAPQINIQKNVAIVRINEHKIDLVNAKIIKGYDEKMFRSEGCLSFPGRVENTMRFQEIQVSNNLVYPNDFVATDLLAVVIQHELDHINGILLPDRAIKPALRPNDACYCGSKRKFKQCHGKNNLK
jgi:peptide deformylase